MCTKSWFKWRRYGGRRLVQFWKSSIVWDIFNRNWRKIKSCQPTLLLGILKRSPNVSSDSTLRTNQFLNPRKSDANLGLFKLHTVRNSERCLTESGESCTSKGYQIEITQEWSRNFAIKWYQKFSFVLSKISNIFDRKKDSKSDAPWWQWNG